jgi:hypothetical protein
MKLMFAMLAGLSVLASGCPAAAQHGHWGGGYHGHGSYGGGWGGGGWRGGYYPGRYYGYGYGAGVALGWGLGYAWGYAPAYAYGAYPYYAYAPRAPVYAPPATYAPPTTYAYVAPPGDHPACNSWLWHEDTRTYSWTPCR